jgi:NAD(P)-dependent dehydrogenase (short-subunit alcohol dehydrogenase family)
MKKLLEGKTAIITGASKGIGLAIAQLYSEEGANVVMTARNKAELNAAVESVTKIGGKAIGVTADVASVASCKEVFAKTIATFGQVDTHIYAAQIGAEQVLRAVIRAGTGDDVEKIAAALRGNAPESRYLGKGGWRGKTTYGINQQIVFPIAMGFIVNGKREPQKRIEVATE